MKGNNKNAKNSPYLATLGVLIGAMGAGAATAQTVSEPRSPSAIMDEVMIYGTKRSSAEEAQDTASQVAAFGEAQLEARHVLNVEDLSFATPNVQLDSVGTQASYASFSIRGLGIDNSTPSIDANVGVFSNGVYNGTGFGVVTDTFDLESIEVYKGPQSLLFGRNVTGGAVLLRSKRPVVGGGFDVNAKAGVETEQQVVGVAAEGDLIGGSLAGRLAVQYSQDDGWFDNEMEGQTGAQDTSLVRGTLVYEFSDTANMTFIAENGSMDGDGTPVQDLNTVPPSAVDPSSNTYTSRFPLRPGNDEFNVNHNFVGVGDVDWIQYTLENSWVFGGATLTNILGYREVEAYAASDIDGTVAQSLASVYVVDQNQLSNELRLNVDLTADWTTTLGLAYFEQEYDYITGLTIGSFDTAPGGNDRLGGGVQEQETLSFYWDNEYKLTDTFSLVGGANYVKEDKDVILVAREQASIADGTCNVVNETCNFAGGYPGSDSWSNVSPKVGFQWWAMDEAQVYGHWTVAYRSGFYNLRPCCTALVTNPTPTDVEKHSAFEVGMKSDWLDRRLRLNTAFFVQNIDDLARSAGYVLPDGAPAQDLVNIGDARITGLEVDLLAQVTDSLVITAAAGLLDGDILDAETDINADGIIGDHADESMALTRLSPKSVNLGFIYDISLGNGILSLSSNYNYRDEAAARDDNGAFFPAATIINAGVDYVPNDGPWSFHLYGKNLRDEVVYSTLFTLSNSRVYAPIKEGRRYGFEVRYDF